MQSRKGGRSSLSEHIGAIRLRLRPELATVNEETLTVNRLEGFLAGSACGSTKYELRLQTPFVRDAPLAGDLFVDEGIVVLKVGTEALLLKESP